MWPFKKKKEEKHVISTARDYQTVAGYISSNTDAGSSELASSDGDLSSSDSDAETSESPSELEAYVREFLSLTDPAKTGAGDAGPSEDVPVTSEAVCPEESVLKGVPAAPNGATLPSRRGADKRECSPRRSQGIAPPRVPADGPLSSGMTATVHRKTGEFTKAEISPLTVRKYVKNERSRDAGRRLCLTTKRFPFLKNGFLAFHANDDTPPSFAHDRGDVDTCHYCTGLWDCAKGEPVQLSEYGHAFRRFGSSIKVEDATLFMKFHFPQPLNKSYISKKERAHSFDHSHYLRPPNFPIVGHLEAWQHMYTGMRGNVYSRMGAVFPLSEEQGFVVGTLPIVDEPDEELIKFMSVPCDRGEKEVTINCRGNSNPYILCKFSQTRGVVPEGCTFAVEGQKVVPGTTLLLPPPEQSLKLTLVDTKTGEVKCAGESQVISRHIDKFYGTLSVSKEPELNANFEIKWSGEGAPERDSFRRFEEGLAMYCNQDKSEVAVVTFINNGGWMHQIADVARIKEVGKQYMSSFSNSNLDKKNNEPGVEPWAQNQLQRCNFVWKMQRVADWKERGFIARMELHNNKIVPVVGHGKQIKIMDSPYENAYGISTGDTEAQSEFITGYGEKLEECFAVCADVESGLCAFFTTDEVSVLL